MTPQSGSAGKVAAPRDQNQPKRGTPTLHSTTSQPNAEQLHTLRQISTQCAQIIAETLDGKRRLAQLETWFDPVCLQVLAEKLPKFAGVRVRLASVRVQPLSTHSAEVSLRLSTPLIEYPAALRICQGDEHWLCTDLVLG